MAIVKAASGGTFGPPEEFGLKDASAAPAGTWVATCINICDQMGVEVQKYQSTELERIDRTCFLFGFRDQAGKQHKVATRWMKISGHPKAKLMEWLNQAMGQPFPLGADYNVPAEQGGMKGRKVLVTTQLVQREGGGTYATITAVCPVPAGYAQPAAAPLPAPAPVAPAPVVQPVPVSAAVDEIPF